jgi:hypothetical protein
MVNIGNIRENRAEVRSDRLEAREDAGKGFPELLDARQGRISQLQARLENKEERRESIVDSLTPPETTPPETVA